MPERPQRARSPRSSLRLPAPLRTSNWEVQTAASRRRRPPGGPCRVPSRRRGTQTRLRKAGNETEAPRGTGTRLRVVCCAWARRRAHARPPGRPGAAQEHTGTMPRRPRASPGKGAGPGARRAALTLAQQPQDARNGAHGGRWRAGSVLVRRGATAARPAALAESHHQHTPLPADLRAMTPGPPPPAAGRHSSRRVQPSNHARLRGCQACGGLRRQGPHPGGQEG